MPACSTASEAGWLSLLLGAILLTSCKPASVEPGRSLVVRYNQAVAEAYRRGDGKLTDPVVGPRESKRLSSLLAVRRDFGLALDSRLLSLEVTSLKQSQTEMRVRTKERWRYRELRIGTGQPVGEASLGSYEILYIFTNINQAWRVDEVRFELARRTPAPPS